jgi:GNAT superfamily N-acetyltransferase
MRESSGMIAHIRPADVDDAAALARLRWEFRSGKAPTTEGHDAFLARATAWMRVRLARGDVWRAWLAVSDTGEPIGTLWLAVIEKLPNPAKEPEEHAYISSVYVRPEARGGVGSALLRTAVDWCAARGVDVVLLWPTERSRPLYTRHGFAPPRDVLARAFDPTPEGERGRET